MTQLAMHLGRMPAGSAVGNDASESAAAEIQRSGRLRTLRRQVLTLFAAAGERGLTADEVVASFGDGTDTNAYAPRVTELRGMGYLAFDRFHIDAPKDAVWQRFTRKGKRANVCVITESGRQQLRAGIPKEEAK